MIVAVTGASGFVGQHVVRHMSRLGHTVHAYGRRPASSLAAPLASYQSWDISSGAIAAPHVDVVIHVAALVGDWGAERAYHAVNVVGTQAVLDSFSDARIVYVSTSSVYSDVQPAGPLHEEASTGDCRFSAYGRTKALAERLVLQRDRSVVIRPHIIYGPGDTTLLPRVLASRQLGTLVVPGSGQNVLSVTHIGNLLSAIVAACDRPDVRGTFNVVDDHAAPLNEILRTLLARAGVPTQLLHVPYDLAWTLAGLLERVWPNNTPPRGPRLTRYLVHQLTSNHVLDTTRAKQMLGYAPQFDFRHPDALTATGL